MHGDMRSVRNRRAVLAGAPEPDARLLRQVHGSEIVCLRRVPCVNAVPEDARHGAHPRADGWITDRPGVVLAVYVADCQPIWIWERSGKAAGVFHAGWRGLAVGLPGLAVAGLCRVFGVRPSDLQACVGPHAGACCYRVGPEVAQRFRPQSLRRCGRDIFLDMGDESRAQLEEAGIPADAVAVSLECTICRTDRFFSYRREGRTGQMLAFLWLGA